MTAALRTLTRRFVPQAYPQRLHRVRSFLSAPRYSGTDVFCPCCGRTFRRFATGGTVRRRANARCAGCGALERHRLVWLFLAQRTDLFRRATRLLHIAPEPFLQERLAGLENVDYISGDLVSPWAMTKMDVTDIPYADASFDAVLCLHVLEHVDDDRAAMRELLRVLKPGGWAIIHCPVQGEETFEDETVVSAGARRRLFGQEDHVRVYGRDLKTRLESVGFVVDVAPFAHQLGDGACRRYGLDSSECIYLSRKPGRA